MRLPSTAVFEITSKCNHKCLFCSCPWEYSNEKPKSELTTKEWKKIIFNFRFYGVKHITFTGGEPTLHKDIVELIEYSSGLGYSLGLVTNGKEITNTLLMAIKKHKVALSISVPGITTFKEHTGVDNIDRVLRLFEICKERGIDTTANITVTKINLFELYENIAYPIMRGANYILLNRFLPGGKGMSNLKYLLSINEINEMLDVAEEVLLRSGIGGHIGTELPYCIIKNPSKYKQLQIANKCGAAKKFFVIDPEGNIKVCNHSPHKVCHYDDIESLKQNEYWQRFITSDYIPTMCLDCKDSTICDGGCREAAHVFFGEIDMSDPCF